MYTYVVAQIYDHLPQSVSRYRVKRQNQYRNVIFCSDFRPLPPHQNHPPDHQPRCRHIHIIYNIHIPNILLRGRQARVALSNAHRDARVSGRYSDGRMCGL